jgi:hypothetical protein
VSRLGSRSRLVADASGAPVLRDQGPMGRPGTARPTYCATQVGRTVSELAPVGQETARAIPSQQSSLMLGAGLTV